MDFSRLSLPIENGDIYLHSSRKNEFDTQIPPGVIDIDKHELFPATQGLKLSMRLNSDLSCSKSEASCRKAVRLDWFKLPAQECTDDSLYEFKALHLRTSADPKSFHRPDNSIKSPPAMFSFGRVVENGRIKTGDCEDSSTCRSKRNKTGSSFVRELLRDSSTQIWANKKYNEIQRKKAKGGKKWYAKQLAKRKKY